MRFLLTVTINDIEQIFYKCYTGLTKNPEKPGIRQFKLKNMDLRNFKKKPRNTKIF